MTTPMQPTVPPPPPSSGGSAAASMMGGMGSGMGGGAGAGAGDYNGLLATVSELQSDLQTAVAMCNQLRDSNDSLQKNYEACRVELVRQREKFQEARSQLIDAHKTKMELDRQNEMAIQRWKAQVEHRQRELEDVQARLVPQDLDVIRIKVQEELEEPHAAKVADLEAQATADQQMFFNVRRELERCKTEFEQFSTFQGDALRA